MLNLVTLMVAVLGFVLFASLGFVFADGDPGAARAAKRAQALVKQARTNQGRTRGGAANDPNARRKQILQNLKDADRQQRKAKLTLAARLKQAGLELSPKKFWIITVVVGVLIALLVLVLSQKPLIALGAGFGLGLGLPRWWLGFLAGRRTKKFTAEFSNAIDVIVRGIKSGLPVGDCLKIIARESPQPLGGEFQRLVDSIAAGVSVEQALEKAYERMPTAELRFFTIVLAIQQRTGGNLAEALGNLSTVIRARKMMREKVKALSSEATASAAIIGCLPPGVCLMVTITTPSYMMPMFTTAQGQMMLLGGVVWMAMGILMMRKMINFRM